MSVFEFVFSPTGGTKNVSSAICEVLGANVQTFDLMDRSIDFSAINIASDDLCVVAVPSFGGRVPAPAVSHLAQLKGNGASAVLVVVYGNRAYEDTLIELQDTLDAAGFKCIAAAAAIAEHSVMHQFAANRPDAQDIEELQNFGKKVLALVQTPSDVSLSLPGNRPYKEFGGLPLKPDVDDSCGMCGLCAASCPVGAIPSSNPSITDKEACITCMSCIKVCPNHSRSLNEDIVAAFTAKLAPICSDRKKNEFFT